MHWQASLFHLGWEAWIGRLHMPTFRIGRLELRLHWQAWFFHLGWEAWIATPQALKKLNMIAPGLGPTCPWPSGTLHFWQKQTFFRYLEFQKCHVWPVHRVPSPMTLQNCSKTAPKNLQNCSKNWWLLQSPCRNQNMVSYCTIWCHIVQYGIILYCMLQAINWYFGKCIVRNMLQNSIESTKSRKKPKHLNT